MRALVIFALMVFSGCSIAASFEVKGNSLAMPSEAIKAKATRSSFGNARYYDPPSIPMYCNETDQEAKGFFSFRGLFFPGFASYRYNTRRDNSRGLIGDETIGGFRISGIGYDTYKDKLVRMEIGIDSQSGPSSTADADRIMRKALGEKFGKASSGTT